MLLRLLGLTVCYYSVHAWGLYHFITADDEDGLLEEEDKDVEDKGAEDEGVIADNDGVTTASVGPAAY